MVIDAEGAAIDHLHLGMGGLEVPDHARNVRLGMAGGEQHAGDDHDLAVSLGRQIRQRRRQQRLGKLKEGIADIVFRQPLPHRRRHPPELVGAIGVAGAMAAQQNGKSLGHDGSLPLRKTRRLVCPAGRGPVNPGTGGLTRGLPPFIP